MYTAQSILGAPFRFLSLDTNGGTCPAGIEVNEAEVASGGGYRQTSELRVCMTAIVVNVFFSQMILLVYIKFAFFM